MKKHLLLIMLMISATFSWAQNHWTIVENASYDRTTKVSFTLDLINGDNSGETLYEIAAFIGDEVRACTTVDNLDGGKYTLDIIGDLNEEKKSAKVSFKLYDSTLGREYDLDVKLAGEIADVVFKGDFSYEEDWGDVYEFTATLAGSGWVVVENESYDRTTKVSFTLDLGNGGDSGNTKYQIAAFIGNEVRALAYVNNKEGDKYNLDVIGSLDEEKKSAAISFKLYNPISEKIYDLEISINGAVKTLVFKGNFSYEENWEEVYEFTAAIVSKIEFKNETRYKGSAGFVPEVKVNNGNLSPEKAPFTLTTEDTDIITIGEDNKIVPVAFGEATVTATYVDDETVTATFVVEVTSALESVVLNHEGEFEYERTAEELITLPGLTFSWLANADVDKDEAYSVKSLAEDVIVIEGNNAKSLKAGVAELVYTSNYDASKCDTLIVNVTQGITKIEVAAHELYYGGEGYIPEVKVYRGEELVADAEYTLSYESEEKIVEIVDGNKINPLKIGEATVKATCAKVETEFTVTVKSALESIALESNTLSYERTTDGEENITLPEPVFNWVKDNDGKPVVNNANVAYTITSSDKTVIRMDGLKAVSLKEGTVKLTYTSGYDATKSVVLTVNVKPQPVANVLHYDFENGIPENVILKDYDGFTPAARLEYPANTAWAVWEDPDDAANSVIASCSFYDEGGAANDWLVIPNITLPEDPAACQMFWRSRSKVDTFKDGYVVAVSTDIIEAGKEISDYKWEFKSYITKTMNPAKWNSWQKDLSKYAGKTISIAFINETGNGWLLLVDDITIGKRERVSKGFVNVVSNIYAANGAGYVSAEFKNGILDEMESFTARVTSGNDVILYEYGKENKDTVIKQNQYHAFRIPTPLRGNAPETKEYCLELLDSDGRCFASDSSHFVYLVDLEGESCVVAESYINNNSIYAVQTIEGYKKVASNPCFIGLQLHGPAGEDPMTPAGEGTYTDLLVNKYGIYRSNMVLVDRMLNGHSYNDIEGFVEVREGKSLLLSTEMSGTVYNNGIVIDMSTSFALDSKLVDCGYELILTEDGVTNTLWNWYSGGSNGLFEGYEKLEDKVLMQFNDVVRKRYKETAMVFGDDIVAGETVTNSHVLPMSSNVNNLDNLKMTVLITDNNTGEIINAARCALERKSGEAPETGVENIEAANGLLIENGVATYSGDSMVEMRVFTMHGVELLHSKGYKDVSIELPRENGVYIIEVLDNNNRYVKKVLR